ncbi:MAG: hypoxanthine phosphoribosyltransferase [Ruminococcus sp.]|nr:hypoxanthine phosphoribosyltransferase [Ruminococcus sp.]
MIITDKNSFNNKIKRILITEDQIKQELESCGSMLSREYEGKPLLLVSILKGSFVFLSDLNKQMSIPCEVGFMAAKSYFEGTSADGEVEITYDLAQDISRYHVLIVEDIIDTGRTLARVLDILRARKPLSLKVVTLLDKPDRRIVDLKADWSLFTIPDHFVIGYGLDCGEYYRNLPYIAEYEE